MNERIRKCCWRFLFLFNVLFLYRRLIIKDYRVVLRKEIYIEERETREKHIPVVVRIIFGSLL